jgi:DNA-directed RNA polymerase sigma subunit (sigma70/sigma32)
LLSRLEGVAPVEAAILRQFFGIGAPARSLAEIGRDHGVSRQRIEQLKHRGLGRLQRLFSRPEKEDDDAGSTTLH